ncbi:hypothetical protein N7505_007516 [Penicillium chrysogenum]|uniref:HAT C-terminal dimerisation domain-containing protein n=1 Tax=Penicillium chrysogenum TaxID=5076 RepID=A0ABQ8WDL4_PENCH|nr:hypothetical protein N7505_007516 [Penicillium chrysogenum]
MARDNLATPASGASVKRLFNCARDICHYRRGQLKPETIRSLILHLFASKFELYENEEDGNHAEDGSDDSENDLGDNHIVEHATPIPVTTVHVGEIGEEDSEEAKVAR